MLAASRGRAVMRAPRWAAVCVLLVRLGVVHGQPLFLSHATHLGGDGTDVITSIAVDVSGNVYASGFTYSTNFPVTPGALQPVNGGVPGTMFGIYGNPQPDAFVAKFDPSGALVYSTYLGSGGYNVIRAIAVDAGGQAVVVGQTASTAFPVTAGALQTAAPPGPGPYSFVAKLNAAGTALVFATYFGISGDSLAAIAVDSQGDLYLAGAASSSHFPISLGAAASGGVFIAKLNQAGSALLYSTLLGAAPSDSPAGIAVDSSGHVYVTGTAVSPAFPTTPGAFQRTSAAPSAAFVAKLDPAGATLLYSTLLGGSGATGAAGRIAVDAPGNVSLTGVTAASDFPVTPGAFQPALAGAENAFVAKMDATLSSLIFSTYLGGSDADRGAGLVQDGSGNLWIAGSTSSNDFPITTAPLTRAFAGSPCVNTGGSPFGENPYIYPCDDAFLAEFSADGSSLLYASTLSGSSQDSATDLALNPSGDIAVAGSTGSNDFPVTLDAFQDHRYRATCIQINSPSSTDTQPCSDGFLALFSATAPPGVPFSILNRQGDHATPIAPNSVVAMFGPAIGPPAAAGLTIDPPGFVSTENSGIRVLFDGTPAPLIFLNLNEISAIVPGDVAGKSRVTVSIEHDGAVVASSTALVGEAAPGLLVLGPDILGQAAIINQDGTLNGPRHPASPGSIVSAFALGVPIPGGPDGQIAGAAAPQASPPQVVIASRGAAAQVLYAGPSPGLIAALTQINFVVPDITGDAVPIYIRCAGFTSASGVVMTIR